MKQEHFRISAVEVSEPYKLTITFVDGAIMTVDLKETIDRIPALSPLKEEDLFRSVDIGEHGLPVEWRQGELDIPKTTSGRRPSNRQAGSRSNGSGIGCTGTTSRWIPQSKPSA